MRLGIKSLNKNKVKCKNKRKDKPRGIDLFAGSGGLSLGFEQAGINIVYAIENDKSAALTYKQNRKRKKIMVDTRNIDKISPDEVLKKIKINKGMLDVIIGGPPCQGFSISNRRTRNSQNPKNNLIFKFVKFVKKIQPKWFLMENVAGLDSFEKGGVRERLLSLFRKAGYHADCKIFNAADFGVPQNRKRVFFIGNRIGAPLDFFEKLKGTKKVVTVNEAISDLPKLTNGQIINSLPYSKMKKLSHYQIIARKGSNGIVQNNLVTKNTDLAIKRFKNIRQGENLKALFSRMPDLVKNYSNIENCHSWIYLRLSSRKPSVTLNNFRKNMLIHPTEDRGLSVREAARLQSFPDKYVFYGNISSQQQQVANAVPPILVRTIAKHILKKL